jgi:hypothetical protein
VHKVKLLLNTPALWDLTLRCYLNGVRRFEGTRRFHTQREKIQEDRCLRYQNSLGLLRWQIAKTRQPSGRTSLEPNFMCGNSDKAIVSGQARTHTYTSSTHKITLFDRTRPAIRTLCVAPHWVMIYIAQKRCEVTIQYSSRTSRRAGKNLKRRDSGPWHGVTDTLCIAWHNTDFRIVPCSETPGRGRWCNDTRSKDPRHVISYTDESRTAAFWCIVWIIHWRKDEASQFVTTVASVQALGCTKASGWRRFEKHKTAHGANKPPQNLNQINLQLIKYSRYRKGISGFSKKELSPIQITHQPDATIFQFIILTFIYSSTCFGRSPAHHQEPCYQHDIKVKPEAATAVIELLMVGGTTPKTCWAVNKRQDNKLKNCRIWLAIYLNCTMMYGLTNLKVKSVCVLIP